MSTKPSDPISAGQILMCPAEHQMQLNYISSIGSYTKRNGTEISVNQALG